MTRLTILLPLLMLSAVPATLLCAADRSLKQNPALAEYFEAEVSRIEQQSSLFNYKSLEQWTAQKQELRSQLFDMLGLSPMPPKTPLNAEVTGTLDQDEFQVQKLHFQSLPGLYVTANLYLPKQIDKPLPTVLYVCGHGGVRKDGVSYGNKTHYQHHGALVCAKWLCLPDH